VGKRCKIADQLKAENISDELGNEKRLQWRNKAHICSVYTLNLEFRQTIFRIYDVSMEVKVLHIRYTGKIRYDIIIDIFKKSILESFKKKKAF